MGFLTLQAITYIQCTKLFHLFPDCILSRHSQKNLQLIHCSNMKYNCILHHQIRILYLPKLLIHGHQSILLIMLTGFRLGFLKHVVTIAYRHITQDLTFKKPEIPRWHSHLHWVILLLLIILETCSSIYAHYSSKKDLGIQTHF